MNHKLYIGDTLVSTPEKKAKGSYVKLKNELFYKIANYDSMPPFFMSIVSNSNHWLFISSKGGLTAGRIDCENALFPYYTDDKIHDSSETTGSKSIFIIARDKKNYLWEPFSIRNEGAYSVSRNLYKNVYGNKLIFEEINHDLELTFSYAWLNSDKFGFIKRSTIKNNSKQQIKLYLLDGIQNIMPYGIRKMMQDDKSTLVDGYKKCELETDSGIGVFSLSSIITDRAEPSESLKASMVWSEGLDNVKYLLTSKQLDLFRKGKNIENEIDINGQRGAYFVNSEIDIESNNEKTWHIVADTNKEASDIAVIKQWIRTKNIRDTINKSINAGTNQLIRIVAHSDGLQKTNDNLSSNRHFSNTLFNVMRGGIFHNNYVIEKADFIKFIKTWNKKAHSQHIDLLRHLPGKIHRANLEQKIKQADDPTLVRLFYEYLPITFSRRHGDPSRPWNFFSIDIKEADGKQKLNYQGNWRDIFQNWEALSLSYPGFVENMICKFVNASTIDGYNPYRITKEGIDWEILDANDPWSNIGYWGDHQIIYLQKFLEISDKYHPEQLDKWFNAKIFVYANVPYRIKSYNDILNDPNNTITYDLDCERKISNQVLKTGADGKLVHANNSVYHVTLIEKLLVTALAKLSNFIPEGGIWLNTQRPEWNDANNALVGNGVSVVTLCYLRRFLSFLLDKLNTSLYNEFSLSEEIVEFLNGIHAVFEKNTELLAASIPGQNIKSITDELGQTATTYRNKVYANSFSGNQVPINKKSLIKFINLSLKYIDHSIRANKRADGLYNAYNLIAFVDNKISISYLPEMLEGQVAVLSSGLLTVKESLNVLDALQKSTMYRKDQKSYTLYPDKKLARFAEKNVIPKEAVEQYEFLKTLITNNSKAIINKDIEGYYHFNSEFKNADHVKIALEELNNTISSQNKACVLELYEQCFNHQSFTGRSGSFYKYEGLGCIYWHMVSKLLLAVGEIFIRTVEQHSDKTMITRIASHYYTIREGIGVNKSPELYGAFPTDPYSHTPGFAGVQQPGLTGQVKEDIISRFMELGVIINKGIIRFTPELLRKSEFFETESSFRFINLENEEQVIALAPDSLVFTYCQVPVIYHLSNKQAITVTSSNNRIKTLTGNDLTYEHSQSLLNREGVIQRLDVYIRKEQLI